MDKYFLGETIKIDFYYKSSLYCKINFLNAVIIFPGAKIFENEENIEIYDLYFKYQNIFPDYF